MGMEQQLPHWILRCSSNSCCYAGSHSWLPLRASRPLPSLSSASLPPRHAPRLVIGWGLLPRSSLPRLAFAPALLVAPASAARSAVACAAVSSGDGALVAALNSPAC
ncbi:hypothetical protein PF008_g1649 [Phytophthora fragariae]|uniref:Uncharacterized protein n=1 Tax=Phytophthora fragariae TaxID=53985 RepID=A0A6G0SJQ9_9STRA|nr:hypothetical protein PF008_g1649 [Phytophthora fragariae]